MKDKKGTIKVSEYQKDEFRKNYQKPEVTDLGKVSELTQDQLSFRVQATSYTF
jgi:hypothetical protein